MGAVYLAYDPMIEREVAIKVLPPEISANEELLKRFLLEARSTGKLNHPNVVAIYDIGHQDSTYYIVMELLNGGSLSDFEPGSDLLAWKEVCEIIAQAADGLAAAHAKGLVHRDVKPENLMRSDQGTVKVVDFGLSKLLDAANDTRTALTQAGQILGTPQYMSPEQFKNADIDFRSDIYSLGGTFFRMLTGQFPFQDCVSIIQVMYAHLEQPVPDPCQINPNLPPGCREIINRAMAKLPEDRYQQAADIAADLRALIATGQKSEPSVREALPEADRPLESAVVIEPAKLPAMMLKNSLANAGAESVTVCHQATEAIGLVSQTVPDLLVTALQLEDLTGIELLSKLSQDDRLRETMLLLYSSDSSPDVLSSIRTQGTIAVVSKTAKPEELICAIHACSRLQVESEFSTAAVEASAVRTLVGCEAGRVPEELAELIRQTGILDLDVTSLDKLREGSLPRDSEDFDLILLVRNQAEETTDQRDFVELVSSLPAANYTAAALLANAGRVRLRAVWRQAFSAVTNVSCDEKRMHRLLQICR